MLAERDSTKRLLTQAVVERSLALAAEFREDQAVRTIAALGKSLKKG